jgi:NADH-quinone oxidoreductase subunit H
LLFAALFLGGWRGPWAEAYPFLGFIYFAIKSMAVYFIVILFRGALPRFRIDQMMDINWKLLTPLALVVVSVTAVLDKLMAGTPRLVYSLVMLAVNAAILLATAEIMRRFASTARVTLDLEQSAAPTAPPDEVSA